MDHSILISHASTLAQEMRADPKIFSKRSGHCFIRFNNDDQIYLIPAKLFIRKIQGPNPIGQRIRSEEWREDGITTIFGPRMTVSEIEFLSLADKYGFRKKYDKAKFWQLG